MPRPPSFRRANGEEPAHPPHPRLADLLHDRQGMMLFEEDLMAAIAALTAWPLEQADALAQALLAAQDEADEIEKLRNRFVAAAQGTGVSTADAASFWDLLGRFVAYSFNQAHATSYADLAWQTAYLKRHHPVPFTCAVLNHYGGMYPPRTLAADFARLGVRLLGPHVNFSQTDCAVEAGAVRVGLKAVKHLTTKARASILRQRPFTELRDLLGRVPLGYRELEALLLSGACDGLEPLSLAVYPIAHQELLERLAHQRDGHALDGFVVRGPYGNRGEMYRALRVHQELRFLGMHLYEHPMRILRGEAARAGCVSTAELRPRRDHNVRLAALVAASRRLRTRAGDIMQFVTLEDEYGLVEAVLLPSVYAALGDPVQNPGPFLVEGQVIDDHGDLSMAIREVMPFHQRGTPSSRRA